MNKQIKNVVNKKIRKVILKAISPFLPFLIIFIGLVFAICTVIDSLFTTEDDMEVMSKLYTDDYEVQYAEWLQEKENSPDTIVDGQGLIPTRNVYLANTRIYTNYLSIWNESQSNRWSL